MNDSAKSKAPKRMECFTAYWNTETHKVTIKLTPELRSDPINMHCALYDIIEDLQQLQKKNLKKAEKAGLDIHLGCDAWPECDESPGGCNHYNQAFESSRRTGAPTADIILRRIREGSQA